MTNSKEAGVWKKVTDVSEVYADQRIRYIDEDDEYYGFDDKSFRKICSTNYNLSVDKHGDIGRYDLFNEYVQVEAFFPDKEPDKKETKVANVKIIRDCAISWHYEIFDLVSSSYCSKASASRAARNLCNKIGFKCKISLIKDKPIIHYD